MALREKDQADFDLERFVDLFDTAMTSDNPTVQRAFKNLLMVAAIASADNADEGLRKGPLRRLVEDVKHLNQRLYHAENRLNQPNQPAVTNVWPSSAQPLIYPYTTTPLNHPYTTTTTSGTSTSISNGAYVDNRNNVMYNQILDNLESK